MPQCSPHRPLKHSMTANSLMQERVFAFLTNPATHALVHRIDTHAASVFLEGDRALKIKHAIRFPYLDYSTLAKRKAACEEEMKVNRQFAPQIYRRVVPIRQAADGSLSIDGDGIPVEYAIEMSSLRRASDPRSSGRIRRPGSQSRQRHCRCDRGLPRRRATGAGRRLDQIDPDLLRGQHPGVAKRSLLCRERRR